VVARVKVVEREVCAAGAACPRQPTACRHRSRGARVPVLRRRRALPSRRSPLVMVNVDGTPSRFLYRSR